MIVLKNLAESFITSAIDASATQITIPADHSGKFPNLLEGDNFRCALVNPATEAVEFINVTARANNVLTVSRGEEGSAPLAFPVESRIHIRMTAKTWEEMAAECWLRPKDTSGDFVLPQYENADSFSLTGDFTSFFSVNRAVKTYPNKSVGFVESAVFVDGLTTVKVIEMTVPADLTHVEAGLDPDALAKRSLSNEELLGYMTPVPILEMEALEVDCGTLVSGTIKHPEAGKTYPDSTEFHFNLPDEITDFSITGQSFQMRMPVVTELESPKTIGPITCRAAQLSLILSDPSNAVSLAVRYVGVKAGVTLAFADTEAGYPGADVNADGAQLPATTAGLDNPTGKAFVSGIVEYFIFGGLIQLKDGTTESVLKLALAVAAGDVILTDQGEVVVVNFTTIGSIRASTTMVPKTTVSMLGEAPVTPATVGADGWADQLRMYSTALNTGADVTALANDFVNTDGMYYLYHIRNWDVVTINNPFAYLLHFDTYGGGSGQQTIGFFFSKAAPEFGGKTGFAACYGADYGNFLEVPDIDRTKEIWLVYSVDKGQVSFGYKYGDKDNRPDSIADLAGSVTFAATPLTAPIMRAAMIGDFSSGQYYVKGDVRHIEYGKTPYAVFTSSITVDPPLPGVPAKAVKKQDVQLKVAAGAIGQSFVESDFTTPLTIDTCILSGDALKYTCAKVPFTDPDIKRLSLSFSGDPSLRVKAAKIYTEEGA
ncbi:hypothetical protein [Maridesulfovibrio sp.]|uniref:hypothetical protein n=1 Tax=Maridesulfovibrio sp. TaxID=2795000 RepID=UPI002AA74844|nr:hypothetical protein [Maridesulfovibrio sp.]